MSYILEALKKLEEKRRSETEPFCLSAEYSGRRERKRGFPWKYLIIFGMFLNLGFFLWLLHSWRSERNLEPGIVNVVRKTQVYGSQDTGRDIMADKPEAFSRQLQPIMNTEAGPAAGYGGGVSTASSQTARPVSEDTHNNTKIISINELPLSVRQKLPDLSISGHFYDSRPSARLLTVGGRILHEGAAAAPGVTLERITADGAVFSCDGIRFHEGIF